MWRCPGVIKLEFIVLRELPLLPSLVCQRLILTIETRVFVGGRAIFLGKFL